MDNFYTSEQTRIQAIEALKPTGEVKRISYNGKYDLYDVYEVPLEHLIYNPHNGRIKSLTLSFESQFHLLDSQNEEDKYVIEQFLYDSAKSRNERTIESLELSGQQEVGIITKDGVIIDGNRRAMLLNLINNRNQDKASRPFKTIVLPDKLKDNRKEIITLETSYQIGVDSKVDYNPIEKYIRCKELQEFYNIDEIANKMAENKNQIQEWLNILDLMEDYLDNVGTPKVYTRLEKREGHFVDLHKYLKSYANQSARQSVNWDYTDSDVQNLKQAYYTYIRLGTPVANTRVIGRPANKNSFFCHEDVWSDFVDDYRKILLKSENVDFNKLKNDNPDFTTDQLIDKVDKKWKQDVEEELDETLFYYDSILGDKIKQLEPLRLLKRAKSTLFQISLEILTQNMNEEHRSLIEDIETRVLTLKHLC
jgi:hypothetical protein